MTDSDLILRMLREFREDMKAFRAETNSRFESIDLRFEAIETRFESLEMRFGVVEHTLDGVAGHVFALTNWFKTMDQRVKKLESRPSK